MSPSMSHPSRVRGLKFSYLSAIVKLRQVAPLAGAWIEIIITNFNKALTEVAPLAGAWIEITIFKSPSILLLVAPLAGAWIEIPLHQP